MTKNFGRRLAAALAASAVALAAFPTYASIDNAVTVSGTAPGGPVGGVTANATEQVDVADAAAQIAVVKTWAFPTGGDINGDGDADVGDTVTYSYAVTNSGNVTLQTVSLADAHDGVGTAPAIIVPASVTADNGSAAAGTLNDSVDTNAGDATWEKLGPGDVITFTSTYTVVVGDFTAAASGDGDIDNTATTEGIYNPGPGQQIASGTGSAALPITIAPSLQIAKLADDDTDVTAGQLVTYTYTVTNNGNVPISNVALADTHNGVAGALTPAFQSFSTNTGSTNTGNVINVLQPGDVAVYTATYTVTQADVDTRQ